MKWENAIKKYDLQGNKWRASQFSHICSKHFLATDFMNVNQQQLNSGLRLKCNAVPSVFQQFHSVPDPSACKQVFQIEIANSFPEYNTTPMQADQTTTQPDLRTLVNDLVDGTTELLPYENLPGVPDYNATNNIYMVSETNESTASNTTPMQADQTTMQPDLTTLVNDLVDGTTELLPYENLPGVPDYNATNNIYMVSETNESTASNTTPMQADQTTMQPDLTTLVNDLVDGTTELLPNENPLDGPDCNNAININFPVIPMKKTKLNNYKDPVELMLGLKEI